jgi:type IV fimbrial biogenesis protein FimT
MKQGEAGMEAYKQRGRTRHKGVTLIETMASVSILAIIGSIAIPSMTNLHRHAQRTTVINDFLHAVYLARSEAVRRNSVVSICRSNDGATCANNAANWNGGWIVFENLNHDQPAELDPGEPIIMRHEPIFGGNFTSNRVSFSFRPYSQSDVTGTLVYCPAKSPAKEARAIIISHTGRPRMSERDASGKALKC